VHAPYCYLWPVWLYIIFPDCISGIKTITLQKVFFWCRIHLWFRLMGGLQTKSMTSQRNRATHKMADMRYYGNVMTTTRWRLYVSMEITKKNYTDITQNTYIQSWMVTDIMARDKCGHLAFPRTLHLQLYRINVESAMRPPLSVVIWLRAECTLASFTAHELCPTR